MLKAIGLRLFGAAVSSRPGAALLKRYAFRTPLRHLHDLDGGLYMGRWAVINEGTLGSRILERLTGYSSVRLHKIMRPDHDRDLHNHPFTYRTFVVRGFYVEERQVGVVTQGRVPHVVFNHAGSTTRMTPQHFHRISDATRDGVWTLFFMTRNRATRFSTGWGFSVYDRFIPSDLYLLRKGYRP
jgi:hypothetical protein